jgi:phage terminase small subunit
MADQLTEKEELFCQAYLIDFNGAKAARDAGYSENSAREIASQNLSKLHIKNRINELRLEMSKGFNVTRERIAQELALIAFGDTKIVFNEDGTLKTPDQWTDEGRLVSSYEESITEFGSVETGGTKKTKKIRLWEKTKAIEQLSRLMGYNEPEKLLLSGVKINVTEPDE